MNISKNIITQPIAAEKLIAKIIPINVATPLPPWNFSYIGKTWPNTAVKPTINCIFMYVGVPGECKIKDVKIWTDTHPFNISKNKTVNPATLPITLKVLVAPALLLP